MIGGCTAFSLAVVALLAWSIMASIDAYGSRSTSPVTQSPVRPASTPARQTRLIEGPVQIKIVLGRLIARERVLVLRDINQIMEKRLQEQGFDVVASADSVLEVRYREMMGQSIMLVAGKDQEEVGEVPTVKAFVQASMSGQNGTLNLGQKTVATRTTPIPIEGDVRSERKRHSNSLNQKVYTDALAFLRRVDLPVPK